MSYSISEIAAHNRRSGNFYFSKDTLRFFGQSLRQFRVKTINGMVNGKPTKRIFVYAPNKHGWSVGEYNPTSGNVMPVRIENKDGMSRDKIVKAICSYSDMALVD